MAGDGPEGDDLDQGRGLPTLSTVCGLSLYQVMPVEMMRRAVDARIRMRLLKLKASPQKVMLTVTWSRTPMTSLALESLLLNTVRRFMRYGVGKGITQSFATWHVCHLHSQPLGELKKFYRYVESFYGGSSNSGPPVLHDRATSCPGDVEDEHDAGQRASEEYRREYNRLLKKKTMQMGQSGVWPLVVSVLLLHPRG